MSIDFPLGDDLAGYIAEAIAADPSFKGTRRRRGGTQAGRCADCAAQALPAEPG